MSAAKLKKIKQASFAYSPKKASPDHEVNGMKKIPKNTKAATMLRSVMDSFVVSMGIALLKLIRKIFMVPKLSFNTKHF